MQMPKFFRKSYYYLRAIPKSVFFNFYYLPWRQAIKLPIMVSHRTKFDKLQGKINLTPGTKTAKIRLGFGKVQVADSAYSRFIWSMDPTGVVNFPLKAKIGTGSKLFISGELTIGNGCNFTGETSIVCRDQISFGEGCLISWQTLFMDTDFHKIHNQQGIWQNSDRAVIIGNKVWIGARTNILKGVVIGDNTVISAAANVVKSFPEADNILGGNPAKIVGSMQGKYFVD
ncbi:MAG: acyltransferase [Oceanospirillaceae bacterium]|nr:acyltransferase [Oceanospirillaceae bacterium]